MMSDKQGDALEAFSRIMTRVPDSYFKGDAIVQMANDEQAVRRVLSEPAVPEWVIETLRIIKNSEPVTGDYLPQSVASEALEHISTDTSKR